MSSNGSGDQRTLKIRNKRGLHARASAKFVTVAGDYNASITVTKDGTSVCGTSIMGLMMLAAGIGEEIDVTVEGEQKDQLLDAIVTLVEDKFGEEI